MKLLFTALLSLIALNVGVTNQTDPTGEWIGSYSSEKATGKIVLKINKDDKGVVSFFWKNHTLRFRLSVYNHL